MPSAMDLLAQVEDEPFYPLNNSSRRVNSRCTRKPCLPDAIHQAAFQKKKSKTSAKGSTPKSKFIMNGLSSSDDGILRCTRNKHKRKRYTERKIPTKRQICRMISSPVERLHKKIESRKFREDNRDCGPRGRPTQESKRKMTKYRRDLQKYHKLVEKQQQDAQQLKLKIATDNHDAVKQLETLSPASFTQIQLREKLKEQTEEFKKVAQKLSSFERLFTSTHSITVRTIPQPESRLSSLLKSIDNGGELRFAFHGTCASRIPSIEQIGLVAGGTCGVKIINGSAFGYGVYLASNAHTSQTYAFNKYRASLLLCAAVVKENDHDDGRIIVVREFERVLPLVEIRHESIVSSMLTVTAVPPASPYHIAAFSPRNWKHSVDMNQKIDQERQELVRYTNYLLDKFSVRDLAEIEVPSVQQVKIRIEGKMVRLGIMQKAVQRLLA